MNYLSDLLHPIFWALGSTGPDTDPGHFCNHSKYPLWVANKVLSFSPRIFIYPIFLYHYSNPTLNLPPRPLLYFTACLSSLSKVKARQNTIPVNPDRASLGLLWVIQRLHEGTGLSVSGLQQSQILILFHQHLHHRRICRKLSRVTVNTCWLP